MLKKYILPFIVIVILCLSVKANATVEYASKTGKECAYCHVEPTGGGILTDSGQEYFKGLSQKGVSYRQLSPLQRIIRFIMGYLHLTTAIIWFGAIFYVHILLKPAYASKGLPRGEMLIGWISITIMAVSGTFLTLSKAPSVDMLYSTRFGVLLLIKISLFILMVTTAFIATFIIGPRLRKGMKETAKAKTNDLTLSELSAYNGKEGSPAYIAYDGKIYDVTNSKLWQSGAHMRKHTAGNDLTDALKTAPHGSDKVFAMQLIGHLQQSSKDQEKPLHEKIFYFMAYSNLILVFLIIFIISLWRWW
ncbi:cytochrome b5 [Candidatus Magnetoovum chiemensis]|nr:cytochrome b5 [Candidatus Magnetoovum chiemensis]